MTLRYSQLITENIKKLGVTEATNQIAMKCLIGGCGNVIRFNINHETTGYSEKSEEKYINKIFKLRGNIALYLPKTEEWAKECELIEKRLKALGYC